MINPQEIAAHPIGADHLSTAGAQEGLSKLEYAAIHIAEGLMAHSSEGGWNLETIPEGAVRLARALLDECAKPVDKTVT